MVAARTYAKYYLDHGGKFTGKPYDLEDSPATSQKYLGYTFEKRAPNVVKAAEETAGQMVTYDGEIVKTPYFSKSDGTYTKSYKSVWGGNEIPYLVPVKDPYCTTSKTFSGHGVGLSACGAAGMADQGFNYVQILKYYYTGVEVTDFY
jgi:SpoIID/LytB domain protein